MPLALSRTGIVFKKCYINNAGGCVIYSVDPETQQTLAGLGLPMLSRSETRSRTVSWGFAAGSVA